MLIRYNSTHKRCSMCAGWLKHEHFYRRGTMDSGLRSACKACESVYWEQWLADNPEKRKKYLQRYYQKNKKKLNAVTRAYYKNNRERIRANARRLYAIAKAEKAREKLAQVEK